MKIDKKLVISWLASLALFTGVGGVALVAPDWISGVPGLAIRFFLGYCGIIVVAQVLAFMEIVRRPREDSFAKSRRSQRRIEPA